MARTTLVCFAWGALLVGGGCGGGSGAAGSMTVGGAAFRGSAAASGVSIVSGDGQASGAVAADGTFLIDVGGLKPPYLLRATFAGGPPLHSMTAGTGRCNVNPLTESAVEAATGDQQEALFAHPDAQALQAATAALPAAKDELQRLLEPLGGMAGVDPFTAPAGGGDTGLPDLVHEGELGGATELRSSDASVFLDGHGGGLTVVSWTGLPAGGQDPSVAVEPAGAALVVWVQPRAAGHWEVWSQRRAPGEGWLAPEQVSDGTADGAAPVVATDATGRAWSAWCQWNGTDASIWAAHRDPDGGWAAPTLVDGRSGYSCAPRLAVNAGGDAAVTWGRQGWDPDHRQDVWISRLTAGGTWGEPELLSDDVASAFGPQVVLSASGEATVAWTQVVGMRQTLWTASAQAGEAFSPATQLSVAGRDVYGQIGIAGDPMGRVVLLWGQAQEGSDGFVPWGARRDATGVWGAAEQIGDGQGDSYFPTVAMNSAGEALAAWKQSEAGRYRITAARLDPVAGWGAPGGIEQGLGDGDYPVSALDEAGHGMVAWSQVEDGVVWIRANRYFTGGAWLGVTDEQHAATALPYLMALYPVALDMNVSGRSVVAWSEDPM